MKYNMQLTTEEQSILDGKEGETKAKVMETLVMFGDIFGAKRMVPVTHLDGHLVISFGIGLLKPLFSTMDKLIADGIKVKGTVTVDSRPVDYANIKYSFLEKIVNEKILYSQQSKYEDQLHKIGLKNDNSFTCTCYLDEVGNIPKKGDVLSWAESSAVVYANSVLGARCNRNSGMLDLFGLILGCVPEFGLLTTQGRKATWIVRVETTELPDAQVLGSAIGMKVIESVPYIYGLDKWLGTKINDNAKGYLKDFGAATASNGAVGLYHINAMTPEAKEQGDKLVAKDAKVYVIDDQELERVQNSYPNMWKKPDSTPKMAFIGCPHLTFMQLNKWTEDIEKGLIDSGQKKVAFETIVCTSPGVSEKFRKTENYQRLLATGTKLTSICPIMYTNNPLTKRKSIATNSNKLRTHSISRFYCSDKLLSLIVGKGEK